MNIKDLNKDNLNEVNTKNVSVATAMKVIDMTIDDCLYKNDNGVFTYNTIHVEIMKLISYVALYTDLSGEDNYYDSYDMLVESGFKEECDYKDSFMTYSYWFDCRLEDKMRENSVENILSRELKKTNDGIFNVFDHVNNMLDKGDPNKIAKYLSKGIEAIASKMPDFSNPDESNSVADVFKKILN